MMINSVDGMAGSKCSMIPSWFEINAWSWVREGCSDIIITRHCCSECTRIEKWICWRMRLPAEYTGIRLHGLIPERWGQQFRCSDCLFPVGDPIIMSAYDVKHPLYLFSDLSHASNKYRSEFDSYSAPQKIKLASSVRFVGGWGFNPHLVPLTPKFSLTLTGSVKNSKNYIADPSGFTTNRVLLHKPRQHVEHYCLLALQSLHNEDLRERPTPTVIISAMSTVVRPQQRPPYQAWNIFRMSLMDVSFISGFYCQLPSGELTEQASGKSGIAQASISPRHSLNVLSTKRRVFITII